MGKFGLGRTLTDLQNEMGAAPEVSILSGTERVVVRQIPIAQIGVNPDQPRKTFTAEDLADLSASIKEKGVLQPILLRSVKNRPYMSEEILNLCGHEIWPPTHGDPTIKGPQPRIITKHQ